MKRYKNYNTAWIIRLCVFITGGIQERDVAVLNPEPAQ
jgi:hypothetical protein